MKRKKKRSTDNARSTATAALGPSYQPPSPSPSRSVSLSVPVGNCGVEGVRLSSSHSPFQDEPQISESRCSMDLSSTSFSQLRREPLEYADRLRSWPSTQLDVDRLHRVRAHFRFRSNIFSVFSGLFGPEAQPSPGRGFPSIVWHPSFSRGFSPRGSNPLPAVGQERRFPVSTKFVRNDDLLCFPGAADGD